MIDEQLLPDENGDAGCVGQHDGGVVPFGQRQRARAGAGVGIELELLRCGGNARPLFLLSLCRRLGSGGGSRGCQLGGGRQRQEIEVRGPAVVVPPQHELARVVGSRDEDGRQGLPRIGNLPRQRDMGHDAAIGDGAGIPLRIGGVLSVAGRSRGFGISRGFGVDRCLGRVALRGVTGLLGPFSLLRGRLLEL